MKIKLFLLFAILISNLSSAQQTMSVKESQAYPATDEYAFICEKYAYSGEVKVQIAKTDKGGILKLTLHIPDNQLKIAGGVYVDLANGDVIACTDKNIKETDASKTTSYYYFTPSEFSKLKKTNIKSIRFIIKGESGKFGDQTGYFTAKNKKNYFSTAFDQSEKNFDTAAEINLLP